MKYRAIIGEDEILVLTENGGVAMILADQSGGIDGVTAKTEYYETRLSDIPHATEDNVFDKLAEGKLYIKDWKEERFDSFVVVMLSLIHI